MPNASGPADDRPYAAPVARSTLTVAAAARRGLLPALGKRAWVGRGNTARSWQGRGPVT